MSLWKKLFIHFLMLLTAVIEFSAFPDTNIESSAESGVDRIWAREWSLGNRKSTSPHLGAVLVHNEIVWGLAEEVSWGWIPGIIVCHISTCKRSICINILTITQYFRDSTFVWQRKNARKQTEKKHHQFPKNHCDNSILEVTKIYPNQFLYFYYKMNWSKTYTDLPEVYVLNEMKNWVTYIQL